MILLFSLSWQVRVVYGGRGTGLWQPAEEVIVLDEKE